MRKKVQWHLLFCLSQFIVHLFTFLLIFWLCSVGGLGALFLGSPARCNLLVFGLFQGFMACCGLFWFGRLCARLFHLHGEWQARQRHRDGEREREREGETQGQVENRIQIWNSTNVIYLLISALPEDRGPAELMLSGKWPAPFRMP